MIRGVIFDLGGTLIHPGDFEEGNARGLQRWLRERGQNLSEVFVEDLRAERRALWENRRGTEEVLATQAIGTVLARHRLPSESAAVTDAERAFFEFELTSARPLPGVLELLDQLHKNGIRVALISNASSHYFVTECCRRLGVARYLDPIVSSAAIGWTKPDRRAFQPVIRAWKIPPGEIVMVGDSLAADVAGAHASGLRSILLTVVHPPGTPTSLESIRPDAVAASLAAVGTIIGQWSDGNR